LSGKTLRIETARVFEPLLSEARYKGAWGGRGSGKSHFFAGLLIEDSLIEKGLRSVCIREVQKSLKESAKRLIEDKLQEHNLGEADGFRVYREVVETPGDGIITFQGMQDHTAESIKSLEGFQRAWVEEGQTLSARSLSLLRPTIRAEGSQIWCSWNPRRKNDPIDLMLRGEGKPTGAVVIRANWSDNPWFPSVLEQERIDCLKGQPDQYDHIWEGGYATVTEGAYYAQALAEARAHKRIGNVARDPLMPIKAFWDIGVRDATAIWVAQFIGREIRVVDYYEAVNQPLASHLDWLRSKGYANATCYLPHDGSQADQVQAVRFEDHVRSAGFEVETIENQGKGAALKRVEAGRRLFPSIWFNEPTCSAGLDALGWYHEKKDEARNYGLGPEHDWSSHGCFHGTTEVLTRYGMRQIMNLPKSGEILTPCGWKQYIHPRITKRAAPLVEVRFTGGYSVTCTPDHLFLTASGWKSAASLTPSTEIQSTLTRSRSISTAVSTGFGLATITCLAAVENCIGMLGRLLSALSRPSATFITETGTSSTIALRTWSAWTRPSTSFFHERNESQPLKGGSLLTQETRQPTGTGHRKGAYGTSDMPNAPNRGRSGSVRKSLASTAGSHFRRWCERVRTAASSVLRPARWLRIESVVTLSEVADVWDITVPDGHWFSLANGAVVHNSDAFGLMCVAYEEPTGKRPAQPRYAGAGGWMQ
jgi:phage terminase large subunit